MNFFNLLCFSTTFFVIGFLTGYFFGGKGRGLQCIRGLSDQSKLSRQYKNFLTYDGTVQSD
ncbi:MAG: hypothetical protein IJZ75_00275 [Clostridia bacterium]|nr:hypothetical protein [Clostridia bacterium]